MKWGLKGGISIYADSGPPRYVLWCCVGNCHQLLTFIQIGSGHTVGERNQIFLTSDTAWSWLLGSLSSTMSCNFSRLFKISFLLFSSKSLTSLTFSRSSMLLLSTISVLWIQWTYFITLPKKLLRLLKRLVSFLPMTHLIILWLMARVIDCPLQILFLQEMVKYKIIYVQ